MGGTGTSGRGRTVLTRPQEASPTHTGPSFLLGWCIYFECYIRRKDMLAGMGKIFLRKETELFWLQ